MSGPLALPAPEGILFGPTFPCPECFCTASVVRWLGKIPRVRYQDPSLADCETTWERISEARNSPEMKRPPTGEPIEGPASIGASEPPVPVSQDTMARNG